MNLIALTPHFKGKRLILGDGQMAAGRNFSMFIDGSGNLIAGGDNERGALARTAGLSSKNAQAFGQTIDVANLKSIRAGLHHVIAFTTDGKAYSAGYNRWGQCGTDVNIGSTIPVDAWHLLGDYVDGDCGDYHSILIDSLGDVYSFGQNRQGQLGRLPYDDAVHELVKSRGSIKKVRCGRHFTVMLTLDGTLVGCGYNKYGQLNSTQNNRTNDVTDWVTIDTGVDDFACGSNHLVYVKAGALLSCGHNFYGQLGSELNTGKNTEVPNAITTGITDVKAVDCGSSHTMYLTNDNKLYGMGYSEYGQLGTVSKINPTPVLIAEGVEAFTCGARHTIWASSTGAAYGIGENVKKAIGSVDASNGLREIEVIQY